VTLCAAKNGAQCCCQPDEEFFCSYSKAIAAEQLAGEIVRTRARLDALVNLANPEPETAAASGLGSNGSDAREPLHASNDPNPKEVAKLDEGGTP
jgi:hypothetical protein